MNKSMSGEAVLITGITGLVGSAACKYFLSQGAKVVGLVKDRNSKVDIMSKGVEVVWGDIRDKSCLQYCLSHYEVSYVLHLASQPIVRICHNDPWTAYETNVMGVISLFEACRALVKPPKKIVVMTSDKAYGPAPVPYREDTPLVGFDSYCTSKACQDLVSLSYARTYGLPIVVVRAGNLYGPGDLNTSRLIPNSTLRLLDGKSPTLYSGVSEFVREFIYVDNIVEAYALLMDKGVNGEAYNVGGTKPQRIGTVIEMIRDKINPDLPIEIVSKDFDEVREQYLDATKIMELGWRPRITLSEGLDKTIAWYRHWRASKGEW